MNSAKKLQLFAVLAILLASALLVSATLAAPGDTTRVSVASVGTQANNRSVLPAISADGRFVAFQSFADNLVSNDTNGVEDLFVYDRQTGQRTRVSIASDGSQANGLSYDASLSRDGRFIAFVSDATNLVSGDTNGTADIFVHDRLTGSTTRVSVASDGTQSNGVALHPSISDDGRYVAFDCRATNLAGSDTNASGDIFVRDLLTHATTRVSITTGGTEGNSDSGSPSISGDGRYVSFVSWSDNLVPGDSNATADIFLRDRVAKVTILISVNSNGVQADNESWPPVVSADGRFVAFMSFAANLVSGDTNNAPDIFVRDRVAGTTSLVSIAGSGGPANAGSENPSISASGQYVAFESAASNLVDQDTNGSLDIFVHNLLTGATTRVSVASDGTQGNGPSVDADISADGRYTAFGSTASNLVDADTNGTDDVFLHEHSTRVLAAAAALPATGFAPGRISSLPAQPADKLYSTDAGLSLEIPALGVRAPIVGVPLGADGRWDVTWLGREAGYLAGTAYPTWQGNSVIAGHVWDADNRPGIFAHLKELKYGDQLRIHGWGQVYIYEVRENRLAWPDQTDVVLKHEDQPWVTLLTCEDFNALFSGYSMRRIVRAVLVGVIAEK